MALYGPRFAKFQERPEFIVVENFTKLYTKTTDIRVEQISGKALSKNFFVPDHNALSCLF